MIDLSPIVLFVYNRPWHTKQTIEALKYNKFATKSELFIYSDNAKSNIEDEGVNAVRNYIRKINGFKRISIIERQTNWGLAKNIIDGVTNVVNRYGKVIVFEDDLITSPYFLIFMNDALNFYKKKKKVWHISGWTPPIDDKGLPDTFLWRVMNCYGWGTWADRWQYFEKDLNKIIRNFSKKEIHRFNLDGEKNFWKQVKSNINGKISTWAIFWYASIFKNKGLCLNPSRSYVRNIGFDGSGVHSLNKMDKDNLILCQKRNILFEEKIIESNLAVERIKGYYQSIRKPFIVRFTNKLKRVF